MTGIELCRALRHLKTKKILLTGDANHKQAVAAFNEGLIDCFIRKDESDLVASLQDHIARLRVKYFNDISIALLNHLQADYLLPQSDPDFIKFFNNWCASNTIKEYYIIDKNGNYLVKNTKNQQFYFVIHTDRTLKIFTDLHSEDDAVLPLVQSVKERSCIPFFGYAKEAWNYDPADWPQYFYQATGFAGRETCYWAVIDCKLLQNEKMLNIA